MHNAVAGENPKNTYLLTFEATGKDTSAFKGNAYYKTRRTLDAAEIDEAIETSVLPALPASFTRVVILNIVNLTQISPR